MYSIFVLISFYFWPFQETAYLFILKDWDSRGAGFGPQVSSAVGRADWGQQLQVEWKGVTTQLLTFSSSLKFCCFPLRDENLKRWEEMGEESSICKIEESLPSFHNGRVKLMISWKPWISSIFPIWLLDPKGLKQNPLLLSRAQQGAE